MGKFNVTLECLCRWATGTMVDSMWGNPDVGATGDGAQHSVLPMGDLDPHLIHSSLGPPEFHIPNDVSIGSDFFAALTVITDRQTDQQTMLLHQ